MIPVSEIFGPTIQGEGYLAGMPSVFLRTGGCDFECSWCDTPWAVKTIHATTWQARSPETVMFMIRKQSDGRPILVTLTGGNPCLHEELGEVISLGHVEGYTFACETQGTVVPSWLRQLDYLVVSPKPPSASVNINKMPVTRKTAASFTTVEQALAFAHEGPPRTSIKVVIVGDLDLEYATEIAAQWPGPMFVQPVTVSKSWSDELVEDNNQRLIMRYQELAAAVLSAKLYNVRVLPQMHVLLYGHERGR